MLDLKEITTTLLGIADDFIHHSRYGFKDEPYRTDKDIAIYHHETNKHVELAILRNISKLHLHLEGTAFFMFTAPGAVLRLGGIDPTDCHSGRYTDFLAAPRVTYPIAPYALHAAGPSRGIAPVSLLIYNPELVRPRTHSAYPDDTFVPAHASMAADTEFYV